MNLLSLPQIHNIYKKMIDRTGGSYGVRDVGLLESAIQHSLQTFDGNDLYTSVTEKCAAICYSIIKNHPFVDGNKRMGIFLLLIFLEINDVHVEYSQLELVELGNGIANGTIELSEIQVWILKHIKDI